MDERRRNEAEIVERVRELGASYRIPVRQVSVNATREVKIPVKGVDNYQGGSDVKMRVGRKIESILGTMDS